MRLRRPAALTAVLAITVGLLALATVRPATAAESTAPLDPTYGDAGIARIPVVEHGNRVILSTTVDPLGRMIVNVAGHDGGLIRLTADGHVDETFGDHGVARIPSDLSFLRMDASADAIVLGGNFFDSVTGEHRAAVLRLHADGTPDNGFGGDGIVTVGQPSATDSAMGVDIGTDGSVAFVVGLEATSVGYSVYHYRADGSPDPGFGTAGALMFAAPTGWVSFCQGLRIDPLGRITFAEADELPDGAGAATEARTMVRRLLPSGALDPSFGAGGISTIPSFEALWLDLDPSDGSVVMGGVDTAGGGSVAKLQADGQIDRRFGGDGVVPSTASSTPVLYAWSIAVLPEGRIVVQSSRRSIDGSVVSVLRPDGTLETAFGDSGVVVTDRRWVWDGVGAGADGRILVASHAAYDPPSGDDDDNVRSYRPDLPELAPSIAGPARTLALVPGRRFATVTWTPPADDGGSPIRAYSVIAVKHATGELAAWRNVAADVRTAAVPDLTVGVLYDVYVVAVTSAGFGMIDVPRSVTPNAAAPPARAPQTSGVSATPVGTRANVAWGPSVERGEAVTHYNVIVIQGGAMTDWQVTGPDQRQVTVPLGALGAAQVYVVAQSKSGYGPLPVPVAVSRAG